MSKVRRVGNVLASGRSDPLMILNRFEEVLRRVRAEYLEMPGMILRPEQVERLCGVDRSLCRMILDSLVQSGFLRMRLDGGYGRATAEVSASSSVERSAPGRSDEGRR
jgi:hypothetical protein